MSGKVYQLLQKAITCHCLGPDGSKLAIATNDEILRIFKRKSGSSGEWEEEAMLKAHEQVITAMDWSCEGKLLTVSADRNGYVWEWQNGQWTPKLVLLRFKRGAMCCKWSVDGKYFAVGGAEGSVAIGHYERDNDWWICKHLKHSLDGSIILSLAWHPSSQWLAISTVAGLIHLVSVDETRFDQKVAPHVQIGSWIHGMNFSSSGTTLAVAAHNGNLYILDNLAEDTQIAEYSANEPIRRVITVTEDCLIASGYTKDSLFLFKKALPGGKWELKGNINKLLHSTINHDKDQQSTAATAKAFGGAMAKFKALDIQGIAINNASTSSDSLMFTGMKKCSMHIGRISDLRLGTNGKLSTSGHDGRIVEWDLKSLL